VSLSQDEYLALRKAKRYAYIDTFRGDAMHQDDNRYEINGVDVADVRNRNEARIAEKIRETLVRMGNPEISPQSIRDAYALALNLLPARYKQGGSIVLREPIRESHLSEAAAHALKKVLIKPKQ
jgi:hypothetical protein